MKKGHGNFLAGLDIGSTAIRMAIGQKQSREEGNFGMQILGVAETASEGIHRGLITSIEDVVSSISSCLERAERMVGVPVDSVWVGISGLHIMSQRSKGIVAVSKADNEIGDEDVSRVVEAARSMAIPLNYEVLHVLPTSFTVDGQTGVKDPVGMTGIRLEVDTQMILGASANIKNITKAVYRAGLEIEDLVLSILANSEVVVTNKQKELGVAIVNIGGATTSLAVFEEGDMLHTAVLPVGSEHITNDIAIGLRSSVDIAEKVKLEFGDCMPDVTFKKEDFDLFDVGSTEHEMVKRKYLREITSARVEEILGKIDQEFRRIQRAGLLPAGVVFTGGGAKLPGLIEIAKKTLRLPAAIGCPLDIMSVTDKINDVAFTTAIGLVKWGAVMGGHKENRSASYTKGMTAITDRVSKFFKALIP